MSKIMFTWEIGEGTGHIMPYVKLISKLEAQGHQISFVLRSLHKAHDIFHDSTVTWYQAPIAFAHTDQLLRPVNSYPKILHNAGYNEAHQLAGMIQAWRNLYALIDPDLIIFDYSPTAMLAAKGLRAKRVAIGTGFHLPPEVHPIPGLQSEQGAEQDPDELLAFEDNMLKTINQALSINHIETLSCFSDLLKVDKTILRTFPEMDHYSERKGANYAGILKSPSGENPNWPNRPGPKIFAYLKPFDTLPKLLELLNQRQYPTLIYGDRVSDDIKKQFTSETLHFVDRPLDISKVGESADIAICNASHGTSTELLLHGIPLLLLPLHAEQNLVARNVVRLGAGLSAPLRHPKGMQVKLDMLVKNKQFKESAKKFAAKYSGFSPESLTETTLQVIDSLLSKNTR